MSIQENILLKEFTTFRTGGVARYFWRIKSVEELKRAVRFAKLKKLPFFVLGKGANVLVSDDGFRGVVIKMEIGGIHFDRNHVTAGAGIDWDFFVSETVKNGLVGLENLSLIPGTVGASAVGNIGAYGVEAKDFIFSVEALNTQTLRIKKFSNKECAFDYRESFFKTKIGKKYIVINVTFALSKEKKFKTEYKDVKLYFANEKIISPTQKNIRDAIIEIRKQKLPGVNEVATAGSFFKNPVVLKRKAETLKKEYPELSIFFEGGKAKLPAGFLIDKICGLKGYKKGNIWTWGKQALCLVHYGNGTTKEILEFAEMIKKEVKKKTGVKLEFEVQMIK